MSQRVRAIALCVLILAVSLPVLAQSPITDGDLQALQEAYEMLLSQGDPEKEIQLVYSINPWDGHQTGDGTFAMKKVDTLFVIADEISLLNARETEVYYWPITREYMADWFGMNEPVEGQLRIRQGNNVVATLEPETYSDYFPDGSSGEKQLLLGDEAIIAYEEYNRAMDEFFKAQTANFELQLEHSRAVEEILKHVNETGEYVAEDEVPKAPRDPVAPSMFVYPPRTAFVINLPAGRYQIEMIDEAGQVIENSVKNLVVFEARRDSLSYMVRSEHMWTRPFRTNDPSEVLYLEGRRIFYLEPFEAEEYNQYQYLKSQILQQPLYGEGVKSSWMWVQTAEADPDLTLQILRDGEVVQEIKRKPYYVRQTAGHALGYNIVEFNQDDPIMQSAAPTFEGYRIELEAVRGGYTMQMLDANGNVIPSSVREIRSINNDAQWALYGVPLIPFVLGLIVYLRRRRLRPRAGKRPVDA